MPCAPTSFLKQGEYEVMVIGKFSSFIICPLNLPIIECSLVPIRYKSSPSILYIMASISSNDITPVTTSLLIINGGMQ